MKYKCKDCGLVFDEDEVKRWEEHYEFWGFPCSEKWSGCPKCYGAYKEYREESEEEDEDNA